jgi:hypothetical protein
MTQNFHQSEKIKFFLNIVFMYFMYQVFKIEQKILALLLIIYLYGIRIRIRLT